MILLSLAVLYSVMKIDRISGFIYYCVGKLYKISDDKDKINEIDKLDEDI